MDNSSLLINGIPLVLALSILVEGSLLESIFPTWKRKQTTWQYLISIILIGFTRMAIFFPLVSIIKIPHFEHSILLGFTAFITVLEFEEIRIRSQDPTLLCILSSMITLCYLATILIFIITVRLDIMILFIIPLYLLNPISRIQFSKTIIQSQTLRVILASTLYSISILIIHLCVTHNFL